VDTPSAILVDIDIRLRP